MFPAVNIVGSPGYYTLKLMNNLAEFILERKRFFIDFSHARFGFSMRSFAFEAKKQNRA